MKYIVNILLFINFLCCAGTSEELFLRAQQQYQEKNYQKAYELYQEIDPKGSAVWYNMGNCLYHLKQFPQAISAWLRAQDAAQGNDYYDCMHNINIVEQELGYAPTLSWVQYGADLMHQWNVPCWLLQILWLLLWYFLILSVIITARFLYRIFMITSTSCGLVMITLLLMVYYQEQHTVYGIVKDTEVPVFIGPDQRFQPMLTISMGNRVTILEQRPDWYKVQYENTVGWIAHNALIMNA